VLRSGRRERTEVVLSDEQSGRALQTVVVEAVLRDERDRLSSLDDLPDRIRRWEAEYQAEEASPA